MAEPAMTFDEIVTPLGTQRFIDEYLGKQPLHLKGSPEKFHSVMNWDVLNNLLGMASIWSTQSLEVVLDKERVPPANYATSAVGRDGGQVLRPDPAKVQRYLKQGATIVANGIEDLTPGLAGVARSLESALGGIAQANLYLSSRRRQGFGAHFDMHDVFAVHAAGEKTWFVFKGREADPINHPKFWGMTKEYHEKKKGELLMEVRMQPGDLLYLPRGQYHYAVADEGGTMHVAFSVTYPIGVDVITHVHQQLVADPLGRANLPRDEAALRERLGQISERIGEFARDPALLGSVLERHRVAGTQRSEYDLLALLAPGKDAYEVKVGLKLVSQGGRHGLVEPGKPGAVEIPAQVVRKLEWVLKRRDFARDELDQAFASESKPVIDGFIDILLKMRLISLR